MGKFRRMKRRAARYFGSKRRSSSRSSGSGLSPMMIAGTGFAYGAVREKIQSYIPDTGLPYSDSLISGVGGWYLAKKGRGIFKNAGYAILAVESASVGNATAGGMFGGSGASTGGASTTYGGFQ